MHVVILVTVPDDKQADFIAQKLVEARLVACVNIVSGVRSLFWWEGKVDQAKETLLIIKTRKALTGKLVKKVKSLHKYTVPEIIALPIIAGNKEYLDWINESTRK
ncbi:MAG: divalent-cation tolerance protein CutA [Candidatus Omnitrophica bacterium]|nr:divalent-cation tolerance protein CutA [Candidatus Omnitrophota bacterium]